MIDNLVLLTMSVRPAIKRYLSLFLLVFVVVLSLSPVFAADNDQPSSAVPSVYEGTNAAMTAVSGDADKNVLQTTANDVTSSITFLNTLVNGVASVNPSIGETAYMTPYGEVPYAWRVGLSGVAEDAMMYAFLAPTFMPTAQVYAEMFSPPILKNEATSTVYAGVFPDDPSFASKNAISILYSMKLFVKLWMFMMGIATIVLVIILVVAGFMIMFRQKVQGQTWVTIGMALQGAVIGFIGALASFAIGGMFFNVSKLLVFFTGSFFSKVYTDVIPADQRPSGSDIILMSPGDPIGLIAGFMTSRDGEYLGTKIGKALEVYLAPEQQDTQNLQEFRNYVFDPDVYKGIPLLDSLTLGWRMFKFEFAHPITVIKADIESAKLLKAKAQGNIIGYLIQFSIGIASFFVAFKVFFKLLATYVNMILEIVLAPLIFVAGSLPGKSGVIKHWFHKMFVYSLVPATMFFLINFAYLLVLYDLTQVTGASGMAALSGGAFQGGAGTGLLGVIGYGRFAAWIILFMAPKADQFLKEQFGLKESSTVAGAMGDLSKSLEGIPLLGSMLKS